MTDELKPCPFCGGEAMVSPRTCDRDTPYDEADRAYPIVRCGSCYAQAYGDNWGEPETAITAWNTRPTEAAIIERCATVAEEEKISLMQHYKRVRKEGSAIYTQSLIERAAALGVAATAIRALSNPNLSQNTAPAVAKDSPELQSPDFHGNPLGVASGWEGE